MVFDANLVLIDGSIDLIPTTDTAPTSCTRDAATGAAVIDLEAGTDASRNIWAQSYLGAGVRDMVAVLTLDGAPSDYADTMVVTIQESDHYSGGFTNVASFPTLYTYMRLLRVQTTTAMVIGDLAETLNGTTTGDDGVIRWFHPNLLGAIGNQGGILVAMAAAGDLFDDVDEAWTCGGTGAGVMLAAAVVPPKPSLSGPNTYTQAFSVTKRYVRAEATVSTGGTYSAQVMLSPYPFKKL